MEPQQIRELGAALRPLVLSPDTTILFATAQGGDDVSWSEDPRADRAPA